MTKNLLARLGALEYSDLLSNLEIDPAEPYGLKWKTVRRGRRDFIGRALWIGYTHYQSAQVLLILSDQWPENENQVATRIDTELGWNLASNLQWTCRGKNRRKKSEEQRIRIVRAILGGDEPDLGHGLRLGALCRKEHRWNDYPLSLRIKHGKGWVCKQCQSERKPGPSKKISQRAWYRANIKELQRKSRERMRIVCANRSQEQKELVAARAREATRRRRAVERGVTFARLSVGQIRQRFQQFDNRCAYCGSAGRMEIEHAIPIARGGTHAIGNILPACSRCNQNKHANPIEDWYKNQDFYSDTRWRKICRVLGWTHSSVGQLSML